MRAYWEGEHLGVDQKRWRAAIAQERYRRPRIKRARSSEVISALFDMYVDTGDARLRSALETMQERGFDHPHAGTWRARERREERVCVWRMHEFRVRRKARSLRQAAATVAVTFGIGGQSFDAVVSRLRKAYRRERPALESGEFTLYFQRPVGELDKRRRT